MGLFLLLTVAGLLIPDPSDNVSTGSEMTEAANDVLGNIDPDAVAKAKPPERVDASGWGSEARSEFITSCTSSYFGPIFAMNEPFNDMSSGEQCGCIYDDISTSGLPFDLLDEAWGTKDSMPDPRMAAAIVDAGLECTLGSFDFSAISD